MGAFSGTGGKHGANEISASRTDSMGPNTTEQEGRGSDKNCGKVLDQLADEVEKEISYHESRSKELTEKLKSLRKLSGDLKKEDAED